MSADGMNGIIQEIQDELERAMRKFPQWPTDPIHAAAVIAEECGELQKAVLEAVYEPHKVSCFNIRTEAVQTAAMCIRFLASAEAYTWHNPTQHLQAKLDRREKVESKDCRDCAEMPDDGTCDKCGDTLLTTKRMFTLKEQLKEGGV
jgi:hypothetical protein